ncbi:DgyrCDS1663 [Dimorphilus gyrociliatus]|uniref:DgyrCDS1663 n=1 Tax=Dimorphilus gyrociliatus TaxID=2664684 RepID=A0A7I8VB69_9ANNE|nr:DgyrCDS1663 [Dimorphilus gyrociliatus]
MSILENLKSASTVCKLHLFLLPIVLLLHIVGIAIPEWIKFGDTKIGLWKLCNYGNCGEYGSNASDYIKACQAFAIIATLSLIGCLVALCLRTFTDLIRKKLLTQIIIATSICSAFSCLITVAVFAGKSNDTGRKNLHAGFALVCISLIGSIVSAILGYIEGKKD